MPKQKLSKWQGPDVKPTLKGVYQTKEHGTVRWRYWHGTYWDVMRETNDSCVFKRDICAPYRSFNQDVTWRGVIE